MRIKTRCESYPGFMKKLLLPVSLKGTLPDWYNVGLRRGDLIDETLTGN